MSEQNLIIASLDIIADKDIDIFPLVYGHYYQECPESEALMLDASAQAKGKMLEEVMRLLMSDDLSVEESYLGFEIKYHEDAYRVHQSMYVSLLNAVVSAIKEALGESWNENFNNAWEKRIASLLQAIKNNAPRADVAMG